MDNRLNGLAFVAPHAFWQSHHLPRPVDAATQRREAYTVSAGVALIRIRGVMDKFNDGWGGVASTFDATNAVKMAASDESVRAILLVLDTPGGSVDGLAELGDAIYAARGKKYTVAQVDGMAASAGYYAASQASRVYANRMDVVGSIGTYMVVDDASEYFKQQGITTHLITTGEYKGAGVMGAPVTEAHLAEFQQMVNTYFEDFKSMIARGRGMSPQAVADLADGRVWIGPAAERVGLIDAVQSFETTYSALAALGQSSPAARMRGSLALAEMDLALMGRKADAD